MSPLARIGLAFILVLALAPMGATQERPGDREAREGAKSRWKKLTQSQRKDLLRRYQEFKALPSAVRDRVRKNVCRLQKMSPEQRQEFRRKLASLSPEERRDLVAGSNGFAQMPPPKQMFVRALGRILHSLPAEERQRIRTLPPGEREAHVRALLEAKVVDTFLTHPQARAEFLAASPEVRKKKMRQVILQRMRPRLPPPKEDADEPEEFDFK